LNALDDQNTQKKATLWHLSRSDEAFDAELVLNIKRLLVRFAKCSEAIVSPSENESATLREAFEV
jgi:hypothetical protein